MNTVAKYLKGMLTCVGILVGILICILTLPFYIKKGITVAGGLNSAIQFVASVLSFLIFMTAYGLSCLMRIRMRRNMVTHGCKFPSLRQVREQWPMIPIAGLIPAGLYIAENIHTVQIGITLLGIRG